MESRKVVHVHLIGQTFNGQTDFYFGSVAAIYGTLNPHILGIRYRSLVQSLSDNGGSYENARCRVASGEIIRKKQNLNKTDIQ